MKVIILITALLFGTPSAQADVMISFDIEKFWDFEALDKINLDIPVTYFVTGEMASKRPDRVAALDGLIGSHSFNHVDLTKLTPDNIRKELRDSRELLQKLTGQEILWYRAPFLANNQIVIDIAVSEGYQYTSSWFSERFNGIETRPVTLGAFSTEAIDYIWYNHLRMKDDLIKAWFGRSFFLSQENDTDLIILLHPQIIEPEMLNWFISYVKDNGGVFSTFVKEKP